MGGYLKENFAVSKRVFEEVDDSLDQSLSKIIFGEDANKLNLTVNTQPAIMAVSIATLEALKLEKGLKIDDFTFCAGHSLGEYSALVASGSLKLSDAAKILKKRGQAMQTAVPIGEGGMAAVLNIDIESLEKFILEKSLLTVEISNDNCPGQCVISGAKQEIENAIRNIEGVKQTKNYLHIGSSSSLKSKAADVVTTSNVISRMYLKDFESNLSPLHVKVYTERQEVYLMGLLSTKEAEDAIKIAKSSKGVKKVIPLFEIDDNYINKY